MHFIYIIIMGLIYSISDADAYFLGPKPFMAFVNGALAQIGVPSDRRHFEFFGPAEALV